MINRPNLHSLILLLMLTVPAAPVISAATQTPWFDVEVVVFSRDAGAAADSEIWPADPGTPVLDTARHLGTSATSNGRKTFPLLPQADWQLKPEAYSVSKRGRGLKLLLHKAWRQPVLSRRSPQPVLLRSSQRGRTGAPLLQGTVNISVSRYLHLDMDLLLQGIRRNPIDGDDVLSGQTQNYRIQAHRRMRSGELHYIDHPLMGVLVLINRFHQPTPAEGEQMQKAAGGKDAKDGSTPTAAEQPAKQP